MATQLTPQRFDLPTIEGWAAGDSRQFAFVVTQDGDPRDITNDSLSWRLQRRPYDASATVIDGDSAGVTVNTDQTVDPTAGEIRVDIAEDTLTGEWGEYTQVITVDPLGDTRLQWRGGVLIEDTG